MSLTKRQNLDLLFGPGEFRVVNLVALFHDQPTAPDKLAANRAVEDEALHRQNITLGRRGVNGYNRAMDLPARLAAKSHEIEIRYNETARSGLPASLQAGYVTKEVEAWVGGEQVGYIRAVYVPGARWKEMSKDPIQFMRQHRGWCLSDDNLGQRWQGAHRYARQSPASQPGMWAGSIWEKDFPDEGTMRQDLDILAKTCPKIKRSMREFRLNFVDKPCVEYAWVEGPFRRQGIATILYRCLGLFLATKGLWIRASGLQQDGAKKCWENMASRPDLFPVRHVFVGPDRRRHVALDYRKQVG